MIETKQKEKKSLDARINENEWPGIDSRYRLIIVAALRSKQIYAGATPRIEADSRWRRNTSIALEEVKRGLVPFVLTEPEKRHKSNGSPDLAPPPPVEVMQNATSTRMQRVAALLSPGETKQHLPK
jgi:DNA-directed RNA polymerase omega subunit